MRTDVASSATLPLLESRVKHLSGPPGAGPGADQAGQAVITAATSAAAVMATRPSAGNRVAGTRLTGPQMLNTASGRPSLGSRTGADTPYSVGSSSPAQSAYPPPRITPSSCSSPAGAGRGLAG